MANKYTNKQLLDFNYQASDAVKSALTQKNNAETALNNHGDFNYSKQTAYDKAMDDILNRKKFTYDLNGDALYQQYKDNYINQGKQAMMDTMGQAAAMTGGYGNSYAATVGNQTYQGYLQNLNNIVPELYQMALDRYNTEGNQLETNYNLLAADRANALSEHESKYNKLLANRDYYSNAYDTAYNRDYTAYTDKVNSNNTQYWNEYNAGYQAERDTIADEQWKKDYDLSERQVKASEAAADAADKTAYYQSQIDELNAKLEDENSKINYYKAIAEIGDGIQQVTRGSRGNTGNGGYSVLGTTYKTLDAAEKALAKYLDDLGLSDMQINAIYEKLGM